MKKIIFSILIVIFFIIVLDKVFLKNDNINNESNNEFENQTAEIEEVKKDCNVLVIGNSITIERDGIGMAASDQYHDYYYLLKTKLEQKYENLTMDRISCIHWEENRIISSRTDWLNENLTEDLVTNKDIVIFQLGDNYTPTENLEDGMTEMVNHIKNYSPNAKMVWVGMWFIDEQRLDLMQQISKKLNIKFVNITDLVVDENKSHIGQEVIGINGEVDKISTIEEAFHPNDIGMEKIADRIYSALD